MGVLNYYRNAGLPAPAATAPRATTPQSPVDFAVSVGKGVANAVTGVASTAMAAPFVAAQKIRGMAYDTQRGNDLYKQGYGKYYDSSLKIAAQGKAGGIQRKPQ